MKGTIKLRGKLMGIFREKGSYRLVGARKRKGET